VLSASIAILAGASLTLIVLSWFGSWYVQQRCLRLAKGFQQELMRRGLLISRCIVGMNQLQ
jgi:predicted permease